MQHDLDGLADCHGIQRRDVHRRVSHGAVREAVMMRIEIVSVLALWAFVALVVLTGGRAG